MVLRVLRSTRVRWGAALAMAAATVVVPVAATPGAAAEVTVRDITRWACPADAVTPFTDIAGSVHELAIACQVEYGFARGTSDTTFSPDLPVTRAQMATFLARGIQFAGVPLDPSDQGFTDIAGNVHEDNINALAALGVVRGTSATTYSPDLPVTRAQMASFIVRSTELAGELPAGEDAFTDDEGNVHEDNINKLAGIGVAQGTGSGMFAPDAAVNRGAMASFLSRTIDYGREQGFFPELGPFEFVNAGLSADQEVPGPGEEGAVGSHFLRRGRVPGVACYDITTHVLEGTPTAAHIHRGAPGETGPPVITLETPVERDEFGSFFTCTAGIDPALLDEILASPDEFYVNVHTAEHPDGAMRGQLGGTVATMSSPLVPEEEVPGPGAEGGEGFAFIRTLTAPGSACIDVEAHGIGEITAAHVHEGAFGEAGPPVITLRPLGSAEFTFGCYANLDQDVLDRMNEDPSAFYVNVHSTDFPDGAVRGQLHRVVTTSFELRGADEVPGPGDPFGRGFGDVEVVEDDVVCYFLNARGVGDVTAAHLHHAPAGAAGPPVITLDLPDATGSVFTCAEGVDPALAADIAANPEDYYVNVHTADYPDGAARGQLHPR